MSETQSATLSRGTLIGRYTIVRLLGEGGMGAVYEGVHETLKKRVAIKVLRPELAARPEQLARFLREGEAAAKIRHPHVVDISDVGIDQGRAYLVMEFLDGETLFDRLDRESRIELPELADLMLPMCAALAAAHDEGVVHRDLKPENLFLARTRDRHLVPKVLDFGISRMVDTQAAMRLTDTAAMLGTPLYMSPEQVTSAYTADPQSDQYSLGVVLYECATGERPFEGETLFLLFSAIAAGTFPSPRERCPQLDPGFEAVILRAMARRPEERFPSVRALGVALLPFASARARAHWQSVLTLQRTPAFASEAQSAKTQSSGTPMPQPRSVRPEAATLAAGGDLDAGREPPASAAEPPHSADEASPAAPSVTSSYGAPAASPPPHAEPPEPTPPFVEPSHTSSITRIEAEPERPEPPRRSRLGAWIALGAVGLLVALVFALGGRGSTARASTEARPTAPPSLSPPPSPPSPARSAAAPAPTPSPPPALSPEPAPSAIAPSPPTLPAPVALPRAPAPPGALAHPLRVVPRRDGGRQTSGNGVVILD